MARDFELYIPDPCEAADFAHYRKQTFIEQLTQSGLDEQLAKAHCITWDDESGIEDWRGYIIDWNNSEEHYFRGVRIAGQLAGMFTGELASNEGFFRGLDLRMLQ